MITQIDDSEEQQPEETVSSQPNREVEERNFGSSSAEMMDNAADSNTVDDSPEFAQSSDDRVSILSVAFDVCAIISEANYH